MYNIKNDLLETKINKNQYREACSCLSISLRYIFSYNILIKAFIKYFKQLKRNVKGFFMALIFTLQQNKFC